MKRTMLKSKIHMATISEANLNYYGSISIDRKLCKNADLLPFEKVEIYNCNNGNRFATYVILGDDGEMCVNGAAARLVQKGDRIIIASYAEYSDQEAHEIDPKLVFVDENNDNQIDPFIEKHQFEHIGKTLVHFSGALNSKYAHSAHPLMTFDHSMYDLQTYQKILFVCTSDSLSFANLLPSIPNKHIFIPKESKSHYHAMCVMANNFTTLLWQTFFGEMQNKFSINAVDAHPLLNQTLKNIQNDHQHALTGPIARGDTETIQKHLSELGDMPYLQQLYQSFIELHKHNERTRHENH